MMPTKAIWYGAVVAALASTAVAQTGDAPTIDKILLAKARTEIKAVLEKYKAISARLEEVSETRYSKAPGPAGTMPFVPHTRRDRVIRLGDEMILDQMRIFDDEPNKPQIRLQCDNADYHFALSKTKETDEDYVLAGQGSGKRKNPLLNQGGFGLHFDMFSHFTDVLIALEKEPSYALSTLRYDDAKGLVRVEWTFGERKNQAHERIDVDPAKDWRVAERRVETIAAIGIDRYTYGEIVGGLTYPTECKGLTTYKLAKAPPNMERVTRLISIKLTDKTPYDFRMSAFGLPEPKGMPAVNRGGVRWYIWLALAAFGAIACRVGFRVLKRRFRHPEPVKQ